MEWYMGKYIRPLSDAVFTIASDDLWIESLAIQQLHTTANLPNMQRVVGMPDLHPYIRPLSDAVFTIASDDLWIESLAIQQLHTTANLPNMQRVVGMPDLHPGRGYPIGAAFFSVGRFYPALVGNDIGCGMALWQTDILTRKYNADKFEKRLSDLDDVAEESWLEENLPSAFAQHPWRSSLGSIGGGNHFAELQQVDREFSDPTITHQGKFTQHAERIGDARFTSRTRLSEWRSVLLWWSVLSGSGRQ